MNGTTTEFFLNGSQILAQKTGDSVMRFFYDSAGKRVGFANGTMLFYYLYNLQGDVIAIVRAATGQIVAKYSYDAWGKCTVTNAAGYAVGEKNPFRYRGYYYDTETGLYYLNSRYYSPEFGRFISADTPDVITVSPDSAFWDKNLFAYCDGNPVTRVDDCGEFWHFIAGAAVGGLISGISTAISGGSLTDVLINTAAGMASGILAASGAGLVTSMALSGAISATSSVASQVATGKFDFTEVVADTAVGVACGGIAGPGASSIASNAGGAKQMISLGKQSFSRTVSAIKQNGISAATATETKKAFKYYIRSTERVTENLFGKSSRLSTALNTLYSWGKSLFKRITG